MSKRTDAEVVMPILVPVLGEELALAIIEHRDDVVRIPLTATAARLQVKEYLKCGDPVDAAETQILRGWRAIKASWYFNEKRKETQSAGRRSVVDAARELISDSRNDNWFQRLQH